MTLQGFAAAATLVFLLAVGVIALSVGRSVLRLRRNSTAPERTVEAVVTGKRTVPRKRSAPACCVAFQTAEGERLEFAVPQPVYHALREGQRGRLTAQGEQFRSFL